MIMNKVYNYMYLHYYSASYAVDQLETPPPPKADYVCIFAF